MLIIIITVPSTYFLFFLTTFPVCAHTCQVDGYNSFHGIWGYNAALTGIAIGGFFVVLNVSVHVIFVVEQIRTVYQSCGILWC